MPVSTAGLTIIAHEVRGGTETIRGGIRRAALIGASIERDRILRIMEHFLDEHELLEAVREAIMAVGVREVVKEGG